MAANRVYTYEVKLNFYYMDKTNNKTVIPSLLLTKMVKRFNYLDNLHPIIEGSCYINIKYLEPMRVNQSKIVAVLRVDSVVRSPMNNYEVLNTDTISTEEYIPFFTDDSFPNYARTKDLAPEDMGSSSSGSTSSDLASAMNHEVKFALYSKNALNFNKPLINFCAKDVDIPTVMKYIISHAQKTCDIKPNVIIDKPDNDSKYPFVIIPGLNPAMAMKWLQVRYGIYNSGLNMVYDAPNLFVLNKFGDKHDYSSDSVSRIIMNIYTDNSVKDVSSSIEIEKNTLTLKVYQNPVKVDRDVYVSELVGNELLYSNYTMAYGTIKNKQGEFDKYTSPIKALKKPTTKHVKSQAKARIDYDELNNPFNVSSFFKASSLHTVISIPEISGVPYFLFKPNVLIAIHIMDDENKSIELNGLYTIQKGDIIFKQDNNNRKDYFSSLHDLVLVRID